MARHRRCQGRYSSSLPADRKFTRHLCPGASGARPLESPSVTRRRTRPRCARVPRTGRQHPPESLGQGLGRRGPAPLVLDTCRRTQYGRIVRSDGGECSGGGILNWMSNAQWWHTPTLGRRVDQCYFRPWDVPARENARLWETAAVQRVHRLERVLTVLHANLAARRTVALLIQIQT